MCVGAQQETLAVGANVSAGRGPRPHNLHIPRFRLAPKAHSFRCSSSPHENRCAGFSREPPLAETCKHTARDELLPYAVLQSRLGLLLFPLPLPLPPGRAKRSGCARRRVSEANRRKAAALRPEMNAERGVEAIRQLPRKPLRTAKCGEVPSLFPKARTHPAQAPKTLPHRLAPPPYSFKPAQRAGFGHESGFFSTAASAPFP